MSQTQIRKPSDTQSSQDSEIQELPGKNEEAEKLKSEIDDLLDEIDAVLEENAQEFVQQYVQRGGE